MVDFEREIEAANTRMENAIKRGPVALAVRYDQRLRRVLVTLGSGLMVGFRPADVQGLERATVTDLSEIEISPSGLGLRFPSVDADVYLPALLGGAFGSERWMAAKLGEAGGKARTPTKVAAARSNGAKGGRPRKQVA